MQRKAYSHDEDIYIVEHYHTDLHRDIADHLERTVKSVRKKSRKNSVWKRKSLSEDGLKRMMKLFAIPRRARPSVDC